VNRSRIPGEGLSSGPIDAAKFKQFRRIQQGKAEKIICFRFYFQEEDRRILYHRCQLNTSCVTRQDMYFYFLFTLLHRFKDA